MSKLELELPEDLTIQQVKAIVSKVEALVKDSQNPNSSVKAECIDRNFGKDRGFGGKERGFGGIFRI